MVGSNPNYRSPYCYPDADLVLRTNDDLLFRVHSSIMKMASGVFRDMLEVAQPAANGLEEDIPIDDHSSVVAQALDIIYPNGAWHGFRP